MALVAGGSVDLMPCVRAWPAAETDRVDDLARAAGAGVFAQAPLPTEDIVTVGGHQWLRFTLTNPTDAHDWVVAFMGAADYLDLRVDGGAAPEIQRSGHVVPPERRPLAAVGYAFPLHIPPGATREVTLRAYLPPHETVFLRAQSRDAFLGDYLWRHLLVLLVLGTMLGLAAYNGIVFAWTRDEPYAWYAAYATASFVAWAAHYGVVAMAVDGNSLRYSINGWAVCLAVICGARFTETFLGVREAAPRLARLFRASYVVGLLVLVSELLLAREDFKVAVSAGLLPSLGLMLVVPIYLLAKGHRRARWLVAAWAPMLLAIAIMPLQRLGLFPTGVLAKEPIALMHGAEVLLLAFALADRIRLLERDREAARTELVEAMAARLAAAERARSAEADRAEALAEAERQRVRAQTDGLTGIGNRAAFATDRVVLEADLAAGHLEDAVLAIIDVDGLKALNDSRGHAAGDAMLKALAAELKRRLRGSDEVYRLGGDEFAILFRGASDARSPLLCERVRAAAAALQADGFSGIGVSVGCASLAEVDGSSTRAFELADQRMYVDKRRGDDPGDAG